MKCYSIDNSIAIRDDIDIKYIEFGADEPRHTHDGLEILYIVRGCGEHSIDDEVVTVKQGTLIIVDFDSVHSINTWETMSYYNILLKPRFLTNNSSAASNLKELMKEHYDYDFDEKFLMVEFVEEEIRKQIEALFFCILREAVDKKERYSHLIRHNLENIINITIRQMNEKCIFKNDPHLNEVINYIGQNCARNLKIDEVAKKFSYTPKYLISKIKEYSGLSFKQILLNRRLNNVIEDLWRSDEPIDAVIEKFGFTNKTYFYEIFTKKYGVKPKFIREYKKNYDKYLAIKTRYGDI